MDKLEKILLIRIAIGFLGIVLLGFLLGTSNYPIEAVYDPPETIETAALIP